MSQSIVDLINELIPTRDGYAHLATAEERDLSDAFRANRDELASILAQYDAYQAERNKLAEAYDALDFTSGTYFSDMADNEQEGDRLDKVGAELADALVALLRKEG